MKIIPCMISLLHLTPCVYVCVFLHHSVEAKVAKILIVETFSDVDEGICQRLTLVLGWTQSRHARKLTSLGYATNKLCCFLFFFYPQKVTHVQPIQSSVWKRSSASETQFQWPPVQEVRRDCVNPIASAVSDHHCELWLRPSSPATLKLFSAANLKTLALF